MRRHSLVMVTLIGVTVGQESAPGGLSGRIAGVIGRNVFLVAGLAALLKAQEPRPMPDLEPVLGGAAGTVLEMSPLAMEALELHGLSITRLFDADASDNVALAETPLYGSLLGSLEAELRELQSRPSVGDIPLPNHPFKISWLRDRRATFELVAAVNRLDRSFVEPGGCGEARLIFRLVLRPDGRPPTALPMTLNMIFAQPRDVEGGGSSCRVRARAWQDLPAGGAARVAALARIYRSLPPFHKLEVNLQNLHGPPLHPGVDDHAEYLLLSFERRGDKLVPRPLLDTPRADLDPAARAELARWIHEHFDEIDAGRYVIPDRFLATRAVSVSPRGHTRKNNRIFAELYGEGAAFADLPYDRARLVKSTGGLLRRLDQGTCTGCHQTRAIAGFHVLGESRDPEARLNALAVPRSSHLSIELRWRSAMTAALAEGAPFDPPRPFAERRSPGPGGYGAHCALDADPTFAGWTCVTGMRCRSLSGDAIGICAPDDGNHEGDACETVHIDGDDGAEGTRFTAGPSEDCVLAGVTAKECTPNWFGFAGGHCSIPCTVPGGRTRDGHSVCTDLPATGYEADCFRLPIPIEQCLPTRSLRRGVRWCDAQNPCRDDYACGRVPGLPPDQGACVPPYFVFQTRVDGPVLDR